MPALYLFRRDNDDDDNFFGLHASFMMAFRTEKFREKLSDTIFCKP